MKQKNSENLKMTKIIKMKDGVIENHAHLKHGIRKLEKDLFTANSSAGDLY